MGATRLPAAHAGPFLAQNHERLISPYMHVGSRKSDGEARSAGRRSDRRPWGNSRGWDRRGGNRVGPALDAGCAWRTSSARRGMSSRWRLDDVRSRGIHGWWRSQCRDQGGGLDACNPPPHGLPSHSLHASFIDYQGANTPMHSHLHSQGGSHPSCTITQPLAGMPPLSTMSPAQASPGAGQQVYPAVGHTPHSEESME